MEGTFLFRVAGTSSHVDGDIDIDLSVALHRGLKLS
jgi:hypothetical protein